jgi:hypothetical protein
VRACTGDLFPMMQALNVNRMVRRSFSHSQHASVRCPPSTAPTLRSCASSLPEALSALLLLLQHSLTNRGNL